MPMPAPRLITVLSSTRSWRPYLPKRSLALLPKITQPKSAEDYRPSVLTATSSESFYKGALAETSGPLPLHVHGATIHSSRSMTVPDSAQALDLFVEAVGSHYLHANLVSKLQSTPSAMLLWRNSLGDRSARTHNTAQEPKVASLTEGLHPCRILFCTGSYDPEPRATPTTRAEKHEMHISDVATGCASTSVAR